MGEEVVGLLGYQDPITDAFARETELPTFATFKQLARNCDMIDVCSPTFTHKEYVLAAASAGKAVFCEKPLALSMTDGREMVEAARAAGVPFGVGHVLRFFPEYEKAAVTARSGELGELAVLRLSRCTFAPKSGWYLDETRSGGVILDLMIHDLDFARYVAGEVTRVYASVDHGLPVSSSGAAPARADEAATAADPEAPDVKEPLGPHAYVILTHANGTLTHVEGSWRMPQPEFHTSFEISGSKGLLIFDSGESSAIVPHLAPAAGTATAAVPEVPVAASLVAEDPYTRELKAFRNSVVAGKKPPIDGEEGLQALQIALAAIKSAGSGEPVEITPLEVSR
jgi:predicted dehydrogenase